MPELDHYIITRYDDIEQVLLDRETWSASNASSPLTPRLPGRAGGARCRLPPRAHAEQRRSAAARSDAQVGADRHDAAPAQRARADAAHLRRRPRAAASSDEPVVDLVDRLAFPFPGYAAFSLLGFPADDTDLLKEWSAKRVLLTYGRLSDDQQVEVAGVIVAFWQYCEDHVAACRSERGDDITSDLRRPGRQQARPAQRLRHRQHGVFDGARRPRDDVQHDRQRNACAAEQPRPVAGA